MAAATRPAAPAAPPPGPEAVRLVDAVAEPGTELHRILTVRVPDLVAYQNARYAARYADAVRAVLAREREVSPGSTAVTETYARQLHG
ncbi:hypothetical protein GCM10018952_33730 [Streptosporangium vulgare]